MLAAPLRAWRRTGSLDSRMVLLMFVGYAFLTMTHSAMRLALTGFVYGLGFIQITRADPHDEPTLPRR